MFVTRLISGISLVIIALVTILAGNGVLAVTLCLVSLIAYRELTKACNVHTEDRKWNALELAGMALSVAYYVLLFITLYRANENGDGVEAVYPVVMIA
ncbi:MAG: hypothetical protein K2K07_08855, partial [Lachnospiraceae bacterium]|nr:hypothetical protein [Lachnospiraceae bacterium]